MAQTSKYAQVLFYEEDDESCSTFHLTGSSVITSYGRALDLYANTPNPASQLIEGNTIKEVLTKTHENINNMANPEWVAKNITPYI